MSLSCLSKCRPGDKVTICYTSSIGVQMARNITPHQREFEVIRMETYRSGYGGETALVPMVGSDSERDGMHATRDDSFIDVEKSRFKYEWIVHPSYNCVVKIRKTNENN